MRIDGFIKVYWPELVIILLMLADMFVHILPAPPFVLLIIVLQFVRLDMVSSVFLCLQSLPIFLGAGLNTMGVSGVGGIMIVLGVALLLYGYSTHRIRISVNGFLSIIPVLAIIILFAVSKTLSSGGDFADQKLFMTVKSFLLTWLAFVVLFSNFKHVNTNLLGLYLFVYAAYLLRLSIDTNTIPGPGGLFDFVFMRTQTIQTLGYIPDVFFINYQFPGSYVIQGLGIMLMRKVRDRRIVYMMFVIGLIISLYAGARQMIIGLLFIFLLWVLMSYRKTGWLIVAGILLLVPVIYSASSNISELFESTVEDGYVEGGGRGLWLLAGVQQFLERPVFGVGFGRYNLLGKYDTYPHNLFVEVLCETGVVGFIIIFGILAAMLYIGRKLIPRYLLYFAGLFIMAMASGGMFDNIVLFSVAFAAVSFIPYKPKRNHENI